MRRALLILLSSLALLVQSAVPPSSGRVQVTTSQYNNSRTGSNASETALTPRNVNARTFGKLFSLNVDGDVYAQPLYLPGIQIPGRGKHDTVFIATEHDSVYAFDANEKAVPLWRTNFAETSGVTTVPAQDTRCPFINPEVGITSTPVIDARRGTLYALARTREALAGGGHFYVQRLHALDITTGRERPGSPVKIQALTGASRQNAFDALLENPRSALLLVNGIVYLAWGSSCDVGNYHGWVMAYDADTLQQKAVFNTSPNSKESAIWQSDTGPAADGSGNVFVVTGNGKFDPVKGHDYGDTVLKLALAGNRFVVRDYFTPHNQQILSQKDLDLGAGGPVLVSDFANYPRALLAGGKDGNLFVINCDNMGQYSPAADRVLQTVTLKGNLHAAPAYWNRHVYVFGDHDVLHELKVQGGRLELAHQGRDAVNPGATPTVSANGDKDGIVWTIATRTWQVFPERDAVLHAYDASDVSHELYNSEESGRDRAGISVRFTIPTVVNGRVYIGTRNEVDVYGLLSPATGRQRAR